MERASLVSAAFYSLILDLIANLHVCTAIILISDYLMDYELLFPFNNKMKLNYHEALYFNVVTITTTGYGDAYPRGDIGKLIVVLIIIKYCYFFAKFLNELLSIIENS